VVGCSETVDPSVSIVGGEILDQLSEHQLRNTDSAPWISLIKKTERSAAELSEELALFYRSTDSVAVTRKLD
jgi:hypothetical protein